MSKTVGVFVFPNDTHVNVRSNTTLTAHEKQLSSHCAVSLRNILHYIPPQPF